jgi:ribosomal-protein-alanine N-acetyltransferase
VIQTERLHLRKLTLDDAPFILKHVNEPSFIENIRDSGVRNLDDAEGYLTKGPLASYEKYGFGLCLMELRESKTPIGMCGLLKRDTLDFPDIGYSLDPAFWKKGYASEAAAAVLDYGFGELGMTRVLAITSPSNEASARLLLRLGMTDDGEVEYAGKPARIFSLVR